jgi:Mg-chelatase subunit ChlD
MAFTPKSNPTSLASILAKNRQEKPDALAQSESKIEKAPVVLNQDPAKATERLRIVFDDSGSMHGQQIEDAKAGCIEFMRNCIPNETACAVHPMSVYDDTGYFNKSMAPAIMTDLTIDLPSLSQEIAKITDTGGTPLFATLRAALTCQPKLTRAIVFSDGSPNGDDLQLKDQTITQAQEQKIPVDTVYITQHYVNNTDYPDPAYRLLKEIADKTGGYCLVFDKNKVNFKDAFKWLAPKLRLALSDGNVRQQLQDGKLK